MEDEKIKSGWGVFSSSNNIKNHNEPNVGINSVFQAELLAILYTLKNSPKQANIRIYSDSKSAVELMNKMIRYTINKIPYKINFNYRWVLTEIYEEIIDRVKQKSNIEIKHIYSHIKEKEKDTKYKDKINQQKELYGEQFERIILGNEEADKLAKEGAKKFKEVTLPITKDNWYLWSLKDGLIHYKLQNYLTKYLMKEKAKKHIERLMEKWKIDISQIHESSFNFDHKTKWRDLESIEFLLRMRQQDLKIKDFIFKNRKNMINPINKTVKSENWSKYWNTAYTDNLCEVCKLRNIIAKEDWEHHIHKCIIHENEEEELLNKISEIIKDNMKNKDDTKLEIPNIFNNKQHIDYKECEKDQPKLGKIGFITKEFYKYLNDIKVKDKKELIFNILIIIGKYSKEKYKERNKITSETLKLDNIMDNIFGIKTKYRFAVNSVE